LPTGGSGTRRTVLPASSDANTYGDSTWSTVWPPPISRSEPTLTAVFTEASSAVSCSGRVLNVSGSVASRNCSPFGARRVNVAPTPISEPSSHGTTTSPGRPPPGQPLRMEYGTSVSSPAPGFGMIESFVQPSEPVQLTFT
jgi:hypothetical protein